MLYRMALSGDRMPPLAMDPYVYPGELVFECVHGDNWQIMLSSRVFDSENSGGTNRKVLIPRVSSPYGGENIERWSIERTSFDPRFFGRPTYAIPSSHLGPLIQSLPAAELSFEFVDREERAIRRFYLCPREDGRVSMTSDIINHPYMALDILFEAKLKPSIEPVRRTAWERLSEDDLPGVDPA